MAVDVVIPQLGESVTEAEIVRWLRADGDEVAVDEPLAEIETDKATAELPAPATGILQIVAKAGSTVKPGDVVARIQESKSKGERRPERTRGIAREAEPQRARDMAREAEPQRTREAEPRSASDAAGPATAAGASRAESRPPRPAHAETSTQDEERAQLSPAVRRLVEENRLDPSSIQASGRGGRLTKEDVLAHLGQNRPAKPERAQESDGGAHAEQSTAGAPAPSSQPPRREHNGSEAQRSDEEPRHAGAGERDDRGARLSLVRGAASQPAQPAQPTAESPAAAPSEGAEEERVRMSRLRRSIAQRLVEAQHTAAILTTFNEIDMSQVMDLRARFKDKFAQTHGIPLGFMSFFARACVLALHEIPEVNARIEGEEIVYSRRVHLGIAASTDRGLVVPVVRNADALSMAELEREIGRLAELARTGRIGLDDLTGGTFTISNGGVFGSLMSTPILNPPQSAILGMHKIEKRAVVVDDQITIRAMMYVALSYDHRLIDGREAVTFLVRVKERLEDPERLMLEI